MRLMLNNGAVQNAPLVDADWSGSYDTIQVENLERAAGIAARLPDIATSRVDVLRLDEPA